MHVMMLYSFEKKKKKKIMMLYSFEGPDGRCFHAAWAVSKSVH